MAYSIFIWLCPFLWSKNDPTRLHKGFIIARLLSSAGVLLMVLPCCLFGNEELGTLLVGTGIMFSVNWQIFAFLSRLEEVYHHAGPGGTWAVFFFLQGFLRTWFYSFRHVITNGRPYMALKVGELVYCMIAWDSIASSSLLGCWVAGFLEMAFSLIQARVVAIMIASSILEMSVWSKRE